MSLPARERGLKLADLRPVVDFFMSLPARERGLKPLTSLEAQGGRESLPARERGLKRWICCGLQQHRGSLPARERGLKLRYSREVVRGCTVAPRAGAWIETHAFINALTIQIQSLPARERGLKLCGRTWVVHEAESLPARERGLKHDLVMDVQPASARRSPRGSVD